MNYQFINYTQFLYTNQILGTLKDLKRAQSTLSNDRFPEAGLIVRPALEKTCPEDHETETFELSEINKYKSLLLTSPYGEVNNKLAITARRSKEASGFYEILSGEEKLIAYLLLGVPEILTIVLPISLNQRSANRTPFQNPSSGSRI
jgi:hypothetical protein